jgi:hypothetical protein
MPMKRVAILLAAVALSVPPLVFVGAAPAGALDQDPVTITPPVNGKGQTYTLRYPIGTLAGNEPSGELNTPDDCPTLTSCAGIPVKVDYPEGYDRANEEFFIDVSVSWDDSEQSVALPGRPAGQDSVKAQGNDIDTWYYVHERDPKDATKMVWRKVAQAAGSRMPEKARWLAGATDYYFVIQNYLGNNTGFAVEIKTTASRFGNPVEDLGFPGFQGEGLAGPETFGTVGDFSGIEGPAASAPPGGLGSAFASSEGGLPLFGSDAVDDTFGTFGGSSAEFENALEGQRIALFKKRQNAGPPKPVGAATVVFWLGLVPLAIAGASIAWFYRRRPAALSFSGAPPTAS